METATISRWPNGGESGSLRAGGHRRGGRERRAAGHYEQIEQIGLRVGEAGYHSLERAHR